MIENIASSKGVNKTSEQFSGDASFVGRVTIPMGSFHVSGGVKVIVKLGNAMASRGCNVTYLVPSYANSSPFYLNTTIRVRTLCSGPIWLPMIMQKAWYYLRLAMEASRDTDYIIANYYVTAYCSYISKFFL